MARAVLVELVCKEEDVVVGTIEASDVISVEAVKATLVGSKRQKLMPSQDLIKEGVQLTCARCHGLLYFRGEDGELLLGIPGAFKVTS